MSYLLSLLVNERGFELKVIKMANQFVTFKFGDVQLLDIINFLGENTCFDSFLKGYKISERKVFFHKEWFEDPGKLNKAHLLRYVPFSSKLRNNNPPIKTIQTFKV